MTEHGDAALIVMALLIVVGIALGVLYSGHRWRDR